MTSTQVLAKLADRDIDGAIYAIVGRYEDPLAKAQSIKTAFHNHRRLYLKNESNRTPEYEFELRALIDKIKQEGSEEDVNRATHLLSAPLIEQNRVYSLPKCKYLDNPEHDLLLHNIRPCTPVFYDFVAPHFIREAATAKTRARRVERMMQTDGRDYNFSLAELDRIVAIAKHAIYTMPTPLATSGDYCRVAAALTILTGRRVGEIVKTLSHQPGPTPFQATVSGVTKGRVLKSTETFTIPLLVPYSDMKMAMDAVRAFRTITGDYDDPQMGSIYATMGGVSKKMFARSLTHTQKRNIYIEMAYRDKENNGFMPQGCSKDAWVKLALCHDLIFPDVTSTYNAMTIV